MYYVQMTTMIDRYSRWFEYEKDSHAKTIASLVGVPADKRTEPSYQKAVDLFAHIMAARRLWLYRLGKLSEGPRDIFPQSVAVESLTLLAEETHSLWDNYIEGLDDVRLSQIFEYRSLDGELFRNSIEEILTQLFGHSWYHRGQIAQLVRSMDCQPAVTDFVYWTREPVTEG